MSAEKPEPKPVVTCAANGPYLVKGLERLLSSRGERIPTRPTLALCRCGASKKKPFCDGTHAKIGFDSSKLTDGSLDKRDDYVGEKITIHDNRGICSHAGFCTDGLPKVWRMNTEPWIDPQAEEPGKIIATVKKCPSGALSYTVDGVEHRDQDREPEIQLVKDGPYAVRGGVELADVPRGEGASHEHYALCRCGGSKNKPFCDGTHWHIGFHDPEGAEEAAETGSEWHRAAGSDELADGEIRTVTLGEVSLVLVRRADAYAALSARCPHQGGPLGEGSLDDEGVLRCPWHGWGFHSLTGEPAAGETHAPAVTFPVDVRDDGVYVRVEKARARGKTVSDVMVQTMVNWGVTHVFGIVGHSNLGLAEAIRKQEAQGKLTYIGVRHEGAAAFAASGYAKLTGKPAACLTIAGPGATNLLTGMWDAKMDRAPVLALTGQVNTQVLGPGAFQEVDLASAFHAVASFSQTVLPASRHAELMTLALKHALVARNVSHLIFPDEVQTLPAGDKAETSRPDGRIGPEVVLPASDVAKRAAARIARAERPAIIVGYGARRGMKEIVRLAERLHAPVLTTFKAKGQISDGHPLAAGVIGRSGTPVASWFMNRSDLLLVFGASFSDHTGIDRTKSIIQVDFDRMALGRIHPVELPVWGDVGVTAGLIHDALPKKAAALDQRVELAERWKLWRKEKKRRTERDRGKGLNSAEIFRVLTEQVPANAVVAVDVGNNTYSFGRYFECREQTVLMSGYLGSIGFGLPAALGAWAAAPDRPILVVAGDGGFGGYLAEFTTAVKYGMGITVVLLNNNEFGKISKEQKTAGWKVWQTSLHNPNFAEYARNCGGYGVRVTDRRELPEALAEAMHHDGPALVEILSDPELI